MSIRLPSTDPDRTVVTTPAHVEIIADRYGVGVVETEGYYYAVVRKPGQDKATVWCAPVPADERAVAS